MVALTVTQVLTSVFACAQDQIIRAMGLDTVTWLPPVMVVTGMVLSMLANYLLFYGYFGSFHGINREIKPFSAGRCWRRSLSR